jgi:hypothetical protein
MPITSYLNGVRFDLETKRVLGVALGWGILMDLLGTPGECRQQAARCQTLAETVSDQRVRALLVSMNEMWTSWLTRLSGSTD